MAISEEIAATEFLALLPSDSWLLSYAIHAYQCTASPLLYHCGVGLTVLGATCPSDLNLQYAIPTYTNNYCLLAGHSGGFKTAAAKIGSKILTDADAGLLGGDATSREGLFDHLATTPRQLIVWEEFGDFLASTKKGYRESMKPFLTRIYDGSPMNSPRAKNKDNAQRISTISRPRLSLIAAGSLSFLEEHTLASDWGGGFFRRWLVMFGESKRQIAIPKPDPDLLRRPALVDSLKQRVTFGKSIDQLGGPVLSPCAGIEPTYAAPAFEAWYHGLYRRSLPTKIEGVRETAGPLVIRTALILSWDYGPAFRAAPGQPFYLDLSVMGPAMALVDLHLAGLVYLSENLAEHHTARLRRLVVRTFKEHPGQPLGLHDLTKHLKLLEKDLAPVLSTLIAEGRLQMGRSNGAGLLAYCLVEDNLFPGS